MKYSAKKEERYARNVCLGLAFLGILILVVFNWNFHLVWSGEKYEVTVVDIHKAHEKCYRISIEYERTGGELVEETIRDCTGEDILFWIEKGDMLPIWETREKPHRHYFPYANAAVKLFLCFFFVFVPLLFAGFGKL